MDQELHETLNELRRGQLSLVQSTARTEGWIEGAAKALDGIMATLGQVGDMREQLAALKERESHTDPQVMLLSGRIDVVERAIQYIRDDERKKWIESLIKTALAGAGGGGLLLLGQHMTAAVVR